MNLSEETFMDLILPKAFMSLWAVDEKYCSLQRIDLKELGPLPKCLM